MNELIIMALLILNHTPSQAVLPVAGYLAPVSTVSMAKIDLPKCEKVEIEFTNEAGTSA